MHIGKFWYTVSPLIRLWNNVVGVFVPSKNIERIKTLESDPMVMVPNAAARIVSKHLQKEHPALSFTRDLTAGRLPFEEAVAKQWVLNSIDIVQYPTTSALLVMFANRNITEEEVRFHIDKFIYHDEIWREGKLSSLPPLAKANENEWEVFAERIRLEIEEYRESGTLNPDFFQLIATKEM